MVGSLIKYCLLCTVVVLSACSVQPVYYPYPVDKTEPAPAQIPAEPRAEPVVDAVPDEAPQEPDRQIAVAQNTALPVAANALIERAHSQRDSGNLPAAIASLERASKIAPAAAEIYYELAVVYKRMQQQSQVKAFVNKAMSLSPSAVLKRKLMSLL